MMLALSPGPLTFRGLADKDKHDVYRIAGIFCRLAVRTYNRQIKVRYMHIYVPYRTASVVLADTGQFF